MLVQKAKSEYEADSPFWPAELISALEESEPNAALKWAIASTEAITDASSPPDIDQCKGWLSQLSQWADHDDGDLMSLADKIWAERQDAFGKAISHLFAAKAKWIDGDNRFYRTHLVKALMFLGQAPGCRSVDLDPVFRLFEEYLSKS